MKKLNLLAMVLVVSLVVALADAVALAETLQVPEGGNAVPLGTIGCFAVLRPTGGQPLEIGSRCARPKPRVSRTGPSKSRWPRIRRAARNAKSGLTLIAVGHWPDIDPSSVSFYSDEGRLEFKGMNVEQSQILWQSPSHSGQEACLAPTATGKFQQCAIPLDRKLPFDTAFRWLPAYAKDGPDVTTFDSQGQRVDVASFKLRPARTIVGQIFAATESLDVSQGMGILPLVHPEAVATVDCGLARCELGEGGILVRGVPAQATQIAVTARLSPRFAISHADRTESSAAGTFTILRCPLTVVSGPPLRDADEPQILVKVAERCRSSARSRWSIGSEPAEIVRTVHTSDGDYVLLRTEQLAGGSVTISATRADSVAGVLGSVTTPTAPAPRPESTLELPGHGPIDFIPTNRDALWSVGGVPHAKVLAAGASGRLHAAHREGSQPSTRKPQERRVRELALRLSSR
jgi:hypothetical protein